LNNIIFILSSFDARKEDEKGGVTKIRIEGIRKAR